MGGGSSSHALLGPPVEIIILDVHPLPSGPSPPLFDITNGWVNPGLLHFVLTPQGHQQLVSIQSTTPPHHSYAGSSLLLRHSCVPPTPLPPYRKQPLVLLGPPTPTLQPSYMLHTQPGPSSPGSPIDSLQLPLSSTYSLHSCFGSSNNHSLLL